MHIHTYRLFGQPTDWARNPFSSCVLRFTFRFFCFCARIWFRIGQMFFYCKYSWPGMPEPVSIWCAARAHTQLSHNRRSLRTDCLNGLTICIHVCEKRKIYFLIAIISNSSFFSLLILLLSLAHRTFVFFSRCIVCVRATPKCSNTNLRKCEKGSNKLHIHKIQR